MSICPRVLAIYAFLKHFGACDLAVVILSPNWKPDGYQVSACLAMKIFTGDEELLAKSLWNYIPRASEREAALAFLEEKMWRMYFASEDDSFKQQIWCLYYDVPVSAERLPW